MDVADAKKLIGGDARIECRDRNGEIVMHQAYVLDVRILPYIGPCFITDIGEISLERVEVAQLISERAA